MLVVGWSNAIKTENKQLYEGPVKCHTHYAGLKNTQSMRYTDNKMYALEVH